MEPKFLKDGSILFGDKDKGLVIENDGLSIYENGEKRPLVASYGDIISAMCRCGTENIADGSYHLDEIEVSICPKCGGLLAKARH